MAREEEIIQAGKIYCKDCVALKFPSCMGNLKRTDILAAYRNGAEWADEHPCQLWKDAQGDDLPKIEREVIVIDIRGKVSYGHRPDAKGFDCKNIDTGEIEHLEPKTYDKGGWNIPNVKYWLDLDLPKMEE